MAYYYKINEAEDPLSMFKELHHQKIKNSKGPKGPKINYDFSKHVLIELLDDSTSESKIWSELGLTNNKSVVHKRIMIDSHRIKCRRAIVVCISCEEARLLAQRLSQSMIMNRCVCAVVIEDLLFDLCLFEKQIIQFGDNRPQQQLLYVSDLNKCREPTGLVKFFKEKFSPFGTILSVLVCPDDDGYAYPEGVIKFAYLSEAFAAELALDQYVIGKERLSVTAHHNILLSQCDLRVRLRDAQWCNNAEPYTFSASPFHSNELNLSAFEEDPVINSVRNLHISSKNGNFNNNESILNDMSVSELKGNECPVNARGSKSKLKNFDSNKNTESHDIGNCFLSHTLPNAEGNDFSLLVSEDMPVVRYANSANMLFSDQFDHESEMNQRTSNDIWSEKGSEVLSESGSFKSCNPGPDTHSSHISATIISSNSHSHDLSTISEYYSSSVCKKMPSLQNDSKNKRKLPTNNSKKKRKHFTPSQKLCLKSQRIGFTQNTVENTNLKSELSNSTTSKMPVKCNKISCKKNFTLYNAISEGTSLMSEDTAFLKVTNWLARVSPSQNIPFISDGGQNFNKRVCSIRSVTSKKQNRISVHNTPSLKPKTTRGSENGMNSDSSSIENEDPDENTVILSKEDFATLQVDKFRSPLQAWLKQELVSATNNSVIMSQETTKSVIVCAAKSKDVIISVGCSYMTCEFCYPQSTDLLLGYS